MYAELYTNHFLNIRCSRATFLAFASYTATALEKSADPALKALGATLRGHLTALGTAVVARQQQAGTGKSLTRTRREVMTLMRDYVRTLTPDVLVPRYRTQPVILDTLLPGGLTAFGKADNEELPVLFEAFTKVLETPERVADLTDKPGKAARLLVAELTEATRLKNEGTKQKRETIGTIGGHWSVLCQDLWQAHCTLLGALWHTPEQAQAFFDYALLPVRNAQRASARAAEKGTTPAQP